MTMFSFNAMPSSVSHVEFRGLRVGGFDFAAIGETSHGLFTHLTDEARLHVRAFERSTHFVLVVAERDVHAAYRAFTPVFVGLQGKHPCAFRLIPFDHVTGRRGPAEETFVADAKPVRAAQLLDETGVFGEATD
jgi:hypothetical protein